MTPIKFLQSHKLSVSIAGAFILWFFSFAVAWGNFWIKISGSAICLALMAAFSGFGPRQWCRFKPMDIIWGAGSAAVLYAIFYLGNAVSSRLYGFAPSQVAELYALGDGAPGWMVCLVLFFITGPCEEIFWRGFVQKEFTRRLGGLKGVSAATFFYTAVNLCAMNVMLIGAAAVAGLFWGALFWRLGRIAPLIISHCIWTTVVFAVFPIRG